MKRLLHPYAPWRLLIMFPQWEMEVGVTVFMLFMFVVFFAIIALLWLFRGFSRELQHPRKAVGYVIRLKESDMRPARSPATALRDTVPRSPGYSQVSGAATVVSLALLLGSR